MEQQLEHNRKNISQQQLEQSNCTVRVQAAGNGQLHSQDLPSTEITEQRMVSGTSAKVFLDTKPGEYGWMRRSSIFGVRTPRQRIVYEL